MAVRRSPSAVATISGAIPNSEYTVMRVSTWSTPNRTSHKAAAAIATFAADGRARVLTLAHPLTRVSARFGTCSGVTPAKAESRLAAGDDKASDRRHRRRVDWRYGRPVARRC